jgi:hypothetical protein
MRSITLPADEYQRHKVDERGDELASVARQHFPSVAASIINAEVDFRDRRIRVAIEESAVWHWRRNGRKNIVTVSYGQLQTPAAVIKRLISAIRASDAARWMRAFDAIDRQTGRRFGSSLKRFIQATPIYDGQFGISSKLNLGPVATIHGGKAKDHFSSDSDYSDTVVFWQLVEICLALLLREGRKPGGGRPKNWLADTVAKQLIMMWRDLSAKPVKSPRYEAGSSRRSGPMVAFVAEGSRIYPEARITIDSGAAWERMLSDLKAYSI